MQWWVSNGFFVVQGTWSNKTTEKYLLARSIASHHSHRKLGKSIPRDPRQYQKIQVVFPASPCFLASNFLKHILEKLLYAIWQVVSRAYAFFGKALRAPVKVAIPLK